MNIHGVRFYSQAVQAINPNDATIFLHDRLSEATSDFYYHFHPLVDTWRDLFFISDYSTLNLWYENEKFRDPEQELKCRFGDDLYAHDTKRQTVILRGGSFSKWAPQLRSCEGMLVYVFGQAPSFELLETLSSREFSLTPFSWPNELRAVLHNWDDMYWQVFTNEPSDIECLVRYHFDNPRLKMFLVDMDLEFPSPSNRELQPVISVNGRGMTETDL